MHLVEKGLTIRNQKHMWADDKYEAWKSRERDVYII